MTVPPPRPPYAPTPGLVTTWAHHTRQATPGTTVVIHHHTAPTAPVIPTLAPDHHDAVDWGRVRRFVRACVTPATVTGAVLSPLWARLVLPLAEQHGLAAIAGLGFMACVWTAVGLGLGRVPRPLFVVVLVATAAGTVELIPAALAHHLTEH